MRFVRYPSPNESKARRELAEKADRILLKDVKERLGKRVRDRIYTKLKHGRFEAR